MLKASKRPYMVSRAWSEIKCNSSVQYQVQYLMSSLITGFCLKKDFVFHCRKGMYMSLQMKTSLINLLSVQSDKRHPRVIDLDRGKTLAKGNVHCMNFFPKSLFSSQRPRPIR